ncbi:type II secretion system minor pseudopilin GspK [Shewanella phaeophyticola]|uniref:Type II secretion system protein K n=1 Tax=Shewanella phaeophyticola TaxID=2978345 RepID=A0ABT2P6T0_9GAMM|nr:type II secretion system minor pseudopilin GspK [Shewanella sp. KJ10-1]MCT8988177.1 type II secretion system minor pseudopilin GspK [Shewanella sp. KJ10-1]
MGGQKQRGVALIVVMLIVAMVVVIATNITSRNQLSMRRTLNMAQYDQAYWYAMSAEELAIKVLKQDFEDAEGTVHLQQYWALANVVFPAEYGEIVGEINDMRACFNVNAVGEPSTETENNQPKMTLAARQFQAMLISLGIDEFGAEQLTQTLKDYIDTDSVSSTYGAEDAEYESRNVPYRAANTLMQHRSELRAVLGFNQNVYINILDYVCAIPGDSRQILNVNTVKVEQAALLVGMLENQVSISEAESIINERPADGYGTIEEFWESSSLSSIEAEDDLKSSFVVDSEYFLLHAGAKVDNAIFRMDSVLKRNGNNLEVLTRQYGGQQ